MHAFACLLILNQNGVRVSDTFCSVNFKLINVKIINMSYYTVSWLLFSVENIPTRNSDVDYRFLEAAKAGDLDTVKVRS